MGCVRRFILSDSCGYYPDRESRLFFLWDELNEFTLADITQLLNRGYRRNGSYYYHTRCRMCHECVPYRIDVTMFRWSRSFRRIQKKNSDLTVSWQKPELTEEKIKLYLAYQKMRHRPQGEQVAKDWIQQNMESLHRQMYSHTRHSLELVIRIDDELIGFAIFDRSLDSLSAVYSVFDPRLKGRSLGAYNILKGIEKTQGLGLRYFNLGLYLKHHPKMYYKKKYQPAEILSGKTWISLQESSQ